MKVFTHGTTIADNIRRAGGGGVGERHSKIDALDKVLGRARYTDDIALPRMVFGKIVRSPHAHAQIRHIDRDSILKRPGVLDVIIGQDMPVKYGVIPWTKDEYPLALEKVRYVGDAVAAVIAETELLADRAAMDLVVEYDPLPPVFNVSVAKSSVDVKVNEKAKEGNITKRVDLSFGDVDGNLARSDLVVAQDFSFHNTTHAPIEPHAAIGDYTPSGRLVVYSSTQVPHYLHRSLAEVLGLSPHLIRVIQPPVGGAFGGKSEPFDLEFVVALASMRLSRPVKILYTREEVFLAHRGRHPMDMRMTMGVSNDGAIMAVKNIIDIDGGAYASFGMITAFYAGQLLCGPIGMRSYHFCATRYYTNKPACGPKRGHGSVQPRFAFEIMCDIMAEKLKMDPIFFRKRNIVEENSTTINGQRVGSLAINQVLDRVAEASKFYDSYRKLPHGRGLGIACSMYISGTNYPIYPNHMPQSSVSIRIDRSGRLHIFSGISDIGQGCNSILAQIAMEELGISSERISIITGDTDLCPVDLGSYSSRVTLMMGLAAQEAMRKARAVMAEAVAQFFNHDDRFSSFDKPAIVANDIGFADDRVFCNFDNELRISLDEAIELSESFHGALLFCGDYRTHDRGGDYRGGSIGASPAYSCTAHVADVSVELKTGMLKIHKIHVAHDCGFAINPDLVEGQIEGSTYMGVAEVALEQMLIDEEQGARLGLLINPSLLDYRLPTTLDTPDIEARMVESMDANGPYGAKEAGEGPLHSAIPAVANAIYDAVGIRLFSLPFSPKKILYALKNIGQ